MRLASEQVQIIEKADGSLKGGGGAQSKGSGLGCIMGKWGPLQIKKGLPRGGVGTLRGAPRA